MEVKVSDAFVSAFAVFPTGRMFPFARPPIFHFLMLCLGLLVSSLRAAATLPSPTTLHSTLSLAEALRIGVAVANVLAATLVLQQSPIRS